MTIVTETRTVILAALEGDLGPTLPPRVETIAAAEHAFEHNCGALGRLQRQQGRRSLSCPKQTRWRPA